LRKFMMLILVAVVIIIVSTGILALTYRGSIAPYGNTPSVEQIRDDTILFIASNHTETTPLMNDLSWSGGKQDTGLLGSETYLFSSGNWLVEIIYPLVHDPLYVITANYTSSDAAVNWAGTYGNGTLSETNSVIDITTNVSLTQGQIRDQTMAFVEIHHNETVLYMQSLTWTGGRATPEGLMGAETYSYQSSGWNVTIQYLVVPNPVYTLTVQYTPLTSGGSTIISWQGTMQNGTITETDYNYAS